MKDEKVDLTIIYLVKILCEYTEDKKLVNLYDIILEIEKHEFKSYQEIIDKLYELREKRSEGKLTWRLVDIIISQYQKFEERKNAKKDIYLNQYADLFIYDFSKTTSEQDSNINPVINNDLANVHYLSDKGLHLKDIRKSIAKADNLNL